MINYRTLRARRKKNRLNPTHVLETAAIASSRGQFVFFIILNSEPVHLLLLLLLLLLLFLRSECSLDRSWANPSQARSGPSARSNGWRRPARFRRTGGWRRGPARPLLARMRRWARVAAQRRASS